MSIMLFAATCSLLFFACMRADQEAADNPPPPAETEPSTAAESSIESAPRTETESQGETEPPTETGAGSSSLVEASADQTSVDDANGDGPLGGSTWNMWWTNSEGSESVALVIRFIGDTSGTIEILNDDTESATSFELNDDALSFEFTRLIGDREVPERSKWDGEFDPGRYLVASGTWQREDWSCPPPPSACEIGPGFTSFDSELVRES